ncbi:MAG: hypothetical protein IJT44_00835 [Clostridia bacterium]|nr:hypothetical protein [Clostridia bacterium]
MTNIAATISTAASGVQVRDYGSTLSWRSTLAWADFYNLSDTATFPTTFSPATCWAEGATPLFQCKAGAYNSSIDDQIDISNATGAGTEYATVKFFVRRMDATGSVTLKPTITVPQNGEANKALKMAVAYHNGTANQGVLGIYSDADYEAIKTNGNYTDTNQDHYISSADTGYDSSKMAAVASTKTFGTDTVTLTNVNTTGTAYVTLYIWLEGNDPDCTNALSNMTATFGIDLEAAS